MIFKNLLCLGSIPWLVHSLAATDSISDADPAQSGYLPNHNMNPAIVGSTSFGILWTNAYGAKEKWYAKALTYTPAGQRQLVFTASSQNWIRTVDAVTGAPIHARQVQPPFLQSDIGCTDIPDTIGITGTPVIDPTTDTAYFFAKGYQGGASSGGVAKGTYNFYAVSLTDLSDRPGFPVLIDGHNADNDPARYFVGGTVLQRPSVTLINGIAFGGFGGHCDKFNYTGMMVAVSTSAGVGVTSLFAMETPPNAPPVDIDIFDENGGKAGIWMGGMAPATDGARIFITTGNGQGHENKDTPASGRSRLSTLDEVIGNLAVSSTGKMTLQDYFEPYEYLGMDAGDRDLGSGGVSLLDPTVFKGKNGVARLAITIGKNGKLYVCNADNLGGFKLGSGGTDNIVQTIISPGPVFGGCGSYPLEGGYIYFTPIGSPTLVYSFGLDQQGGPLFSKVGQSPDNSAGRVGVGVPTITTYKGQSGTGILWVTDVDGGLKAYKAVPDSTGKLTRLNIPPTGGLNKFQRPGFGDGRLYVTDNNGHLICLGSPVSLPLSCSSPIDFGDLSLGSTQTVQVNCTTLIAITKLNGATTADPAFQVSNASLPTGPLAAGAKFSFPVVWNLTNANIQDAQGASFGSVDPGVKSSSLVIFTINAVAQYSTSYPIGLVGKEVSSQPFLFVSPSEVDFGGIVKGGPGAATGLDSAFILANIGKQPLKITGYGYTEDLDPPIDYTNVTFGANSQVGDVFTSSDLPAIGSIVAAGDSLTVPLKFKPDEVGNYNNFLQIWTNGGNKNILMTGSSSTAPIAELAVETSEHGWDPSGIMDFGDVPAGTTQTRRIRICNTGGSALHITKSKPPIQPELLAENPTSDLHEGQTIPVNECAYGPIDIAAAPETPNVPDHQVSDTWTLNCDDLTFGVHVVEIKANIVARSVGPKNSDNQPRFKYLGCYSDGTGRQLSKLFDLGTGNDNGACQTKCLGLGYKFAGTEYRTQCWCGNTPPSGLKYNSESLKKCTFGCSADSTQACGGDGTHISIYYDATSYKPDCNAIPCSSSSSVISSTPTSTPTSTSTTTTSSSSVIPPKPTGPVTNPGNTDYKYVDCYQDVGTKAITPNVAYKNDLVTVAVCLAFCKSKGSTYAGLEYRRECYCGNALAANAVKGATGCSLTCFSNSTEYCGGSLRMNLYQAIDSSSTSSSSSSSSSVSSSTTSTSGTSTSPTGTSSTPAKATHGFSYAGCYAEPLNHKAMKLISANDSMSVEFCIGEAQSRLSATPATTYNYIGVEYGRECYGATAPVTSQTSLVGNKACTFACKGNTTESCGGRTMYNYYITTGITTSSSSIPLSTTGTIVTATAK